MSDLFEQSAPPPLAKFQERIVHPTNTEIIQLDERARKLTKEQMKRLKRERAAAAAVLKQYDYDNQRQRYEELKQEFHDLKVAHFNLDDKACDEARQIRRRAASALLMAKRIAAAIEPAKRHAALVQQIDKRMDEHRAAVANERLYDRLHKEMAKEARIIGGLLIDTWTALGMRHRYTKKNRTLTHRVSFARIVVTPDQIQYKVKVASLSLLGSTRRHLPESVKVWDLVKPDTLLDLEAACERQVTSPHAESDFTMQNGAWVVVHRLGLTDGLFNYVRLEELMKRYPSAASEKIPLPLGVKTGRKINWQYLTRHPHVLVTGQTGSGKSNTMHVIISTLISRHSPGELRLVLVDFKEGVELIRYKDAPHVAAFVQEADEAAQILTRIEAMRVARMQQIRAVAVDIDGYNRVVSPERRIPRVIIVIDEYQGVDDKELAALINRKASLIATKGRASGVHLVIGTQAAYSDVLPPLVRANITLSLGGRQRIQSASMAASGNSAARHLANIPGRTLCDDGDQFAVQMPHCTETDIAAALEAAAHWPATRPLDLPGIDELIAVMPHEPIREIGIGRVDHRTVIEVAILQNDGRLSAQTIHQVIGDRIGEKKLRGIISQIAEMGTVSFEGVTYNVKRERNAYRLVQLGNSATLNSDENAALPA